jgi:peptidoglycan/xylan/chitin deacetylase (PgdA/CDA1 family)
MKIKKKLTFQQKLWQQASEFADEVCLAKMDFLTQLGQRIMPDGVWGAKACWLDRPEQLCLTFDDGPDPYTVPRLLELLEEEKVKATFFVVGSRVARQEKLVAKIAQAGHSIANHSYTHEFLPLLSVKRLEHEIISTNKLVYEISGTTPKLFRPPFGIMDQRVADCLKEQGMSTVYWGAVPEDWLFPGSDRVVRRVMRRVNHGALIVLHEGRQIAQQTVAAAKEIIFRGKQLGYEFVDVPDLITH